VSHRERNDLQRSADPQLRQMWPSWRKLFPVLSLLWCKKAILQPLPKMSQWAHWAIKLRWQHMRQLLCDSEQQRLLIKTDSKTQKPCNKVRILPLCHFAGLTRAAEWKYVWWRWLNDVLNDLHNKYWVPPHSSPRPGVSKLFFARGAHKLLHNSSRAEHLTSYVMWLFRDMLQSTKSKMFRKHINFLLLTNCLCGQKRNSLGRICPAGRSWRPLSKALISLTLHVVPW